MKIQLFVRSKLLKTAKVLLLFLFVLFTFSCKNSNGDKIKKYIIRVDNTKYIDKDIIKEKNGREYIIDTNGKEQEILDNIFDATVGEVAYFGEYGKAKIPFVVIRRNKDFMEIMSIPKFNLMREENIFISTDKWSKVESFNLLNTVFLKTCFSDKEIENIVPFEYVEVGLQIEPDKELLKEFSIVYDQNYKDKYGNPTIFSKVLLHENYVNGIYNNTYKKDYFDATDKVGDKVVAAIHSMWNCEVMNKEKGIMYSYDFKDLAYKTGIDVYEYNSRIELRLNNIETEKYKRKANGFKHIATGSDLEEKEYGYYYLRDGNIVKDEIVENGSTKYYLSNTGKAVPLKNFSIQDFNGTKVLICDDVIVREKIINKDDIAIEDIDNTNVVKYYVDINGIVHNLVSDIKDADISDTVMFGHKNNDVNEHLLWRVVENLGGVYILVLENKIALDIINTNVEKREEDIYDGRVSYFDTGNNWEESDRRKYLNDVFYNEVFSDSEKEVIVANPLRAESYIKEKYFGGFKGKDVYDKVFIYNENTTDYLKKYAGLFEMLNIKKPSVYNKEDLDLDFSLTDSDMKSIRPWIVVNLSGENVPEDNTNKNFIDVNVEDKEAYEIPRIKTKLINGVKLGKYLQYGDKKTNINWTLLAIDGDIAYYRASQVLDFEKIVESKDKEIKWSNSELRKWLNEAFMYKIFSSDEIAKLEKIKKKYQYIDSSGNIKEEECEDFITLLNYDEFPIYAGVRLSNKAFEKIDAIDRKGTAAVTSLFDNRSRKFYSSCYKSDDVGNSVDGKIEIKVNDTDYIGILPVIAININKIVDINTNQKIKKNPDKQEEWMNEEISNSQFLFKEGLYGDVIKMGKYQNKDLEWVVLDRVREYALVISRKSLFIDNNLGRYGTTSWETSNVREKLNTEIYDECFSGEEKKRIKPVKLYTEYTESEARSTKEDPSNMYSLDDETIDYLFLPEEKDIKIITKPPLKTAYNDIEKIWFRNGDMNGFFAGNFKEVVDLNISRKSKKYAVRPLMWIKY